MMTLSELSIKRPVFAWMLMAGLIVFGGICFLRMGISQLPDVDYPVVSVNIRLEGAAPEVIETSIVDIVEDAVMSIQSVRSVTSESEDSEGTITIEFELNRNIDLAIQDVQAKVDSVLQKLPKTITSPTIRKSNPEDQPIMSLTLASDKYPLKDLMAFVNDRLKDQFSMVAGVGDITLGGYRDPNLRIWVNEKKMNNLSFSVDDVINTIMNEHMESPAGQLDSGKQQLNVRTMGEAKTTDEFGDLIINQRGGQPNYTRLRLKQVARVEEGLADPLSISRAMGTPCVALNILKQRGSNAVEVAKAVRAKILEVQKGLPEGMTLAINFDSTRFIEQAVRELNFTLLLAALLTALVCWMFLGSWSSTLNVILAIPTSVVGSFIVLYFAGFTLNTFTLLGLSLSIGIVVDDAIMVLENIIRHREAGKSRFLAALVGSREITFAAIAATISIVAIFLPVAFMSGVIGKFFFQFGVTITVAVLLSLLEALTLTPMRCSQFVDIAPRKTRLGQLMEILMDKAGRFYSKTLSVALDYPFSITLKDAGSVDFPVPSLISFFSFWLLTISFVALGCFILLKLNLLLVHLTSTWLQPLLGFVAVIAFMTIGIKNFRVFRFYMARLFWIFPKKLISEIQEEVKNQKQSFVPISCFVAEVSLFWIFSSFRNPFLLSPGLIFLPLSILGWILKKENSLKGPVGHYLAVSSVSILLILITVFPELPTWLTSALIILAVSIFFLHWLIYFCFNRNFFFAHLLYDHRWWVILGAFVIFGLSFLTLGFINKEFIPSQDQSRFNIRLKTPVGSALSYSDLKFSEVEKFLASRSEVDRYVLQVGGGSPGDSNSGSVLVTLKDQGKRGVDPKVGHEMSQQEFMGLCRKQLNAIPDIRAVIQDLSTKAFTASRGFPVEFLIQGPDWVKLADYSDQMVDELGKTGLVTDLDTNYAVGQPELHIVPDRKKAAAYGVSIATIAETINAMIGGVLVNTYEKGGHRYDIRVKLEPSAEDPREKIKSLFVRNNRGELTALSNLVTMEDTKGMVSIWRSNRERSISVYANVKAGQSQQDALRAVQTIAKKILPPDYHITLSGTSQTFTESINSLVLVMILGIFVAYMVLASQFNSFIDPLSVLMALPFSVSGAILALFATHRSINVYSMIGLILLMGIVKKNSILLVDFTNQVREKGETVRKALLTACPIRLRPILMTSVATVAGAIPAALAFGPGAETSNPMAIAIIGGVIFSTVLTLYVVPCFYSVMTRFEKRHEHKKIMAEAVKEESRLSRRKKSRA